MTTITVQAYVNLAFAVLSTSLAREGTKWPRPTWPIVSYILSTLASSLIHHGIMVCKIPVSSSVEEGWCSITFYRIPTWTLRLSDKPSCLSLTAGLVLRPRGEPARSIALSLQTGHHRCRHMDCVIVMKWLSLCSARSTDQFWSFGQETLGREL